MVLFISLFVQRWAWNIRIEHQCHDKQDMTAGREHVIAD